MTLLLLSVPKNIFCQATSKYIVVDQFGYLPDSKKIAVLRDPQVGFDASESFVPGATYAVVDKSSGEKVFSGSPVVWNAGNTDPSSGDKVWWFDFTSVSSQGNYYVLDVENNLRSFEFSISPAVYNDLLRHAVRAFFYQRAGYEKKAQFAGSEWADGASHLGPLQDKNARPYNEKTNASKEVDVHGGWYDAGDFNKYSSWTASYIIDFMKAYSEAPTVWGDDYNLPESGNGIPDLLDEATWGIDHLLRMQLKNGGVLSIVGMAHASPPSASSGQSLYGNANTSATLKSSAAFAIASKVFSSRGNLAYADTLKNRAIKAWNWAELNPAVIFRNNDASAGTTGLGAGQQETDDYGRFVAKMEAACFLFEITGDEKYKNFFESNYKKVHMMEWNFVFAFEPAPQETLLYYTTLNGVTSSVAAEIKNVYKNGMNSEINFTAFLNKVDPYNAFIKDYTWGSNSIKSIQGLMFKNMVTYGIDPASDVNAMQAAEGYIHYIHGVNPLNIVYLSNMYAYGGDNCVNEFYHTWFSDKSPKWDRVGTSTYGPAPGFVTGGANPSYDWDGCCPGGCGGNSCTTETISPPKGQPSQKSYKDFNTSWPLNSWSVTENSNGYQINYIRLLSQFIKADYDCSGTQNGTASYDICNKCSGGNTGITPITDLDKCNITTSLAEEIMSSIAVFPNPVEGFLKIENKRMDKLEVRIINSIGKTFLTDKIESDKKYDWSGLPSGMYIVILKSGLIEKSYKVIKL